MLENTQSAVFMLIGLYAPHYAYKGQDMYE